MISIIHQAKNWLSRDSRGFTLMELTVAMAVGAFVVAGVLAVWTQLFSVTTANSNYMAAFRQVQDGGDWISRDALMTQAVYDMASATLASDVDPGDSEISVDSADAFPPSGVICIENELIQYTGIDYDDDKFTGCTWGGNPSDPVGIQDVTIFISLSWTKPSTATPSEWDQHQVVYNLKTSNGELVRSHFIFDDEGTLVDASTTVVARSLDPAVTTSVWDYDEKELTVQITAQIGDERATRTYRVHPRPLF